MDKIQILSIVEKFVTLKKRGTTYFGNCPLHNERTPSFVVHPAKNIYKCFGCGKGGDAFDFIMKLKGVNFKDAKYMLSEITGMSLYEYKKPERVINGIKPDYIPNIPYQQLYKGNLYHFLTSKFPGSDIQSIYNSYSVYEVGNNWAAFWYVDFNGNLRSAKYMKYLPTGRRDKDSTVSWEHKKRDSKGEVYPEFIFSQCFFGEHLLSKDLRKPIAVVESEKTAIIASIFIDKYIWIACGSKNGLNRSKCTVLANRSVTLFPDLGAYDLWKEKSDELGFNISDHLEKIATPEQRSNGYDLADFLL